MTILELKQYFQNTKEPKFFLKDFFSWRGNYSEIAFTPTLNGTKEKSLSIFGRCYQSNLWWIEWWTI